MLFFTVSHCRTPETVIVLETDSLGFKSPLSPCHLLSLNLWCTYLFSTLSFSILICYKVAMFIEYSTIYFTVLHIVSNRVTTQRMLVTISVTIVAVAGTFIRHCCGYDFLPWRRNPIFLRLQPFNLSGDLQLQLKQFVLNPVTLSETSIKFALLSVERVRRSYWGMSLKVSFIYKGIWGRNISSLLHVVLCCLWHQGVWCSCNNEWHGTKTK